MPKIVNISASADFELNINLNELSNNLRNSSIDFKYDKKIFSGLIIRFKEKGSKFTASIFHTGKIIFTGMTSIEEANKASNALFDLLVKLNFKPKNKILKIQNIVCAGLKKPEKLELIYERIRERDNKIFVSYEPEIFPGMICKNKLENWSLTIFRSGKFFITGCKSMNEIFRANLFYKHFLL